MVNYKEIAYYKIKEALESWGYEDTEFFANYVQGIIDMTETLQDIE